MPDEAISQMADAGGITGTERIPLVRLGSPNLNLSTSPSTLSAFFSIQWMNLGDNSSVTLGNGTTVNETVAIFDNLGIGSTNPVVNGNFNAGSQLAFSQNYQAILFIWNGSVWNVPSWFGVL